MCLLGMKTYRMMFRWWTILHAFTQHLWQRRSVQRSTLDVNPAEHSWSNNPFEPTPEKDVYLTDLRPGNPACSSITYNR